MGLNWQDKYKSSSQSEQEHKILTILPNIKSARGRTSAKSATGAT
jgi:hypothetical protein